MVKNEVNFLGGSAAHGAPTIYAGGGRSSSFFSIVLSRLAPPVCSYRWRSEAEYLPRKEEIR